MSRGCMWLLAAGGSSLIDIVQAITRKSCMLMTMHFFSFLVQMTVREASPNNVTPQFPTCSRTH